jgi:hypothetical protein
MQTPTIPELLLWAFGALVGALLAKNPTSVFKLLNYGRNVSLSNRVAYGWRIGGFLFAIGMLAHLFNRLRLWHQ